MRSFISILLGLAAPVVNAVDLSTSPIWTSDCETIYLDESVGDISQLCAGLEGYDLIVHESDLRQSADIVDSRGVAHRLNF